MNGTIICTIDDSEGVEAAIQIAKRLAERFDARVLLVNIADGLRPGTVNREGLTASLERLVAKHDLSRAEYRVAAGDPAEAVAVIAAEEAADLIVVGARRGLLGRTLRSSLATELAATAACPVVVAPPESREPTGEPVQRSALARHR